MGPHQDARRARRVAPQEAREPELDRDGRAASATGWIRNAHDPPPRLHYLIITAFALALLADPTRHHVRTPGEGPAALRHRTRRRRDGLARRRPARQRASTGAVGRHRTLCDANGWPRHRRRTTTASPCSTPNTPAAAAATTRHGPEISSALHGDRARGHAPLRHRAARRSSTRPSRPPRTGRVNGAVRITYPTATLDSSRSRHVGPARAAVPRRPCARSQSSASCSRGASPVPCDGSSRRPTSSRPATSMRTSTIDSGPPELRHLAATFNRMAGRARNACSTRSSGSSPTRRISCEHR